MISVLIFGFLWWSSSWWWRPHIAACKLCWSLLRPGEVVLDQFFCKMYFLHISRSRKKNFVKFLRVLPPFQGGKTWGAVLNPGLRWKSENEVHCNEIIGLKANSVWFPFCTSILDFHLISGFWSSFILSRPSINDLITMHLISGFSPQSWI